MNRSRTKILLYHAIVKEEQFNPSLDPADQCLTDEEFERQMEFISQNFEVISLDDFFNSSRRTNRPYIIITFDDGFMNNYTVAYPILKKYNIKASIFLTASFISGQETLWFLGLESELKKSMRNLPFEEFKERVISLKKNAPTRNLYRDKQDFFQPMDWNHVRELSMDPRITIGSHCITHYPLNILPEKELREEICVSKTNIEANLGKKVDYISYPHGIVTEDVTRIVKEAGYKGGITTAHGFNGSSSDPYRLKRNEIGNRGNLDILSSVISGSWDMFRWGAPNY